MFSKNNITTDYLRDLAHCTTWLSDLCLGELLQMLGEGRGGMYKSVICDTKPAISLKRNSLESKLLQSVHTLCFKKSSHL